MDNSTALIIGYLMGAIASFSGMWIMYIITKKIAEDQK